MLAYPACALGFTQTQFY